MKKISGYESAKGRVFKHKNHAVAQDLVDLVETCGEELEFSTALVMADKADAFVRCLKQMSEDPDG